MGIFPGRLIPEAIATLFKKRVTSLYPWSKPEKPERFRGRVVFDESDCTGCGLCAKNCPAKALWVDRNEDGTVTWGYDLSQCLYCGQCIEICPTDSIGQTAEFEFASPDKERFVMEQRFRR